MKSFFKFSGQAAAPRLLITVFCLSLILGMFPSLSFADGGAEQIRTVYLVVREGEKVAVWNDDIAQSGVTSNTITVKVKDNTVYDAVFSESQGRVAALAYRNSGIDSWRTEGYFKKDKNDPGGMLLWISVSRGEALIRIDSAGTGLAQEPLTAYYTENPPLEYRFMDEKYFGDYFPPQGWELSYVPLIVWAKTGTEFVRWMTDTYNRLVFTPEGLSAALYNGKNKLDAVTMAYSFTYEASGSVYHGLTLQLPATSNPTGLLCIYSGSMFCAVPRLQERSQNLAVWEASAAGGYAEPADYAPFPSESVQNVITPSYRSFEVSPGPNMFEVGVHGGELSPSASSRIAKESLNNARVANGSDLNSQDPLFCQLSALSGTNEGNASGPEAGWDKVNTSGELSGSAILGYQTSAKTYRIYVAGGSADRYLAEEGATVSLSAEVPDEMFFVRWECNAPIDFNASLPQTEAVMAGDDTEVFFRAVFESVKYRVSGGAEHGSIITDKSEAAAGETVTVNVIPDGGYGALSASASFSGGAVTLTQDSVDLSEYTFVMPKGDVSLSAVFGKIPLAVALSAQHGTVTADKQTALLGETVTLTLIPQNQFCHLGSLTVRCEDDDVPTVKVNDSTYTFVMPGGDVNVTALFAENRLVFFNNWNGETLQWSDAAPGDTPVYNGETPVKAADEVYTYVFSGWDKQITSVSPNDPYVIYTATFTPVLRSYTVTFAGSSVQSGLVRYGETPAYTGETPVKAADESFIYTFAGWSPQIGPVTGDVTYTPVFDPLPILHTGSNSVRLEQYNEVFLPFTPSQSGTYRVRSSGDEVHPNYSLRDSSGTNIQLENNSYNADGKFNFEFIAQLEAGTEYYLRLEARYASGDVMIGVYRVEMHDIIFDDELLHVSFFGPERAYTGEQFNVFVNTDSGYGVVEKTVTDENGNSVYSDKYDNYIMPASDVYVSAQIAPAYTISYDIGYEVRMAAGRAVIPDWLSGTGEDCAAAGAGVEYSFEWDEGFILDNLTVRTQSGVDVPFKTYGLYLNALDIWFTMPGEPITVTVDVVEAVTVELVSGDGSGKTVRAAAPAGGTYPLPYCGFTPPAGKVFGKWLVDGEYKNAGDTVTVYDGMTVTAVYADRVAPQKAGVTVGKLTMNGNTTLFARAAQGSEVNGALLYTAVYDSNEALVSVSAIEQAARNGMMEFTLSEPSVAPGQTYKLFLWDSQMRPLMLPERSVD